MTNLPSVARELATAAEFDSWYSSFYSATPTHSRELNNEISPSQVSVDDQTLLAVSTPITVTYEDYQNSLAWSSNKDASDARFTLFPLLPIELRLKIWRETFPGPRIIELLCEDGPDSSTFHVDVTLWALLNTNVEARTEVLRLFEPALREQKDVIDYNDALVDLEVDTIILPDFDVSDLGISVLRIFGHYGQMRLDELSSSVFSRLKYLAVEFFAFEYLMAEYSDDAAMSLLKFRNLESITILIKNKERHDGDLTLFTPYEATVLTVPPEMLNGYDGSRDLLRGFSVELGENQNWGAPAWEIINQDDGLVDQILGIGIHEYRGDEFQAYLWNIYWVFVECVEKDSTWKVPKIYFKGVKRGGKFSE